MTEASSPALPAAFAPGHVAVITGAASGIGLAAAEKCLSLGMRVCLADLPGEALDAAAARLSALSSQGVLAAPIDVSDRDAVLDLKREVYARFGAAHVLMNNAGTEGGGALFGDPARWRRILDVNLMGVIHGIDVFAPAMMDQAAGPAAIISTGSKQGITTPPGDTAYNVSKAGVKVVTEALAHALRQREGHGVTAHLLIPGFTFTGFTRARHAEKPPGAWTPMQVIDFMLERMSAGDFYILCPDNDVSRPLDQARMRWASDDVVMNRPALSRWHPDHAEAFAAHVAAWLARA